jgi:hypothetical protein
VHLTTGALIKGIEIDGSLMEAVLLVNIILIHIQPVAAVL